MGAEVTHEERERLKAAKEILDGSNWFVDLLSLLGTPIDFSLKRLPVAAQEKIHSAVKKSLGVAVKASGMQRSRSTNAHKKLHLIAAGTAGAAGGFFGLAGVLVELPISTTLIMRSITAVARSHGEDTSKPEVQAEIISIFMLGRPSSEDDAADTSYYALRYALSSAGKTVSTALAKVLSRFSVVVSEKVLAQSVPIIGAVGGAAVNSIFIDYYQKIAEAHFFIRSLERKYGKERVEELYGGV